jgi:hypothetical protein
MKRELFFSNHIESLFQFAEIMKTWTVMKPELLIIVGLNQLPGHIIGL